MADRESVNNVSIFRAAIEDENGQVDAANLGMFWINVVVLGAITFDCAMSLASWAMQCFGHAQVCTYDPTPHGMAVGAICAGYASALGAHGAYMRLVQPRKDRSDESNSQTAG